jgi:hypothetical protein
VGQFSELPSEFKLLPRHTLEWPLVRPGGDLANILVMTGVAGGSIRRAGNASGETDSDWLAWVGDGTRAQDLSVEASAPR